ncbi:MAG: hypothetical protein Ctma_0604 [Catillopecten margaritatus gill symbiont]|uniref:Antitoxin n=1 Tax=Catillopecten margaritatus gill symbiont TaxID=3083288 RepID=A0AAU6PFW3_9GAMM
MQAIFSDHIASITELKKSPTKILEEAGGYPVAILNHNIASSYLVPAEMYEKMMGDLEDYYLMPLINERLKYKDEDLIEVDIKDLMNDDF